MSILDRDRITIDGEIARQLGRPRAANPHPLDTEAGRAWDEGWLVIDALVQAQPFAPGRAMREAVRRDCAEHRDLHEGNVVH